MKILVRVDEEAFAVDVEDVQARPVVAMIDGERFEVWPEGSPAPATPAVVPPPAFVEVLPLTPPVAALPPHQNGHGLAASGSPQVVRAPIPGVIVAVSAQPGATVTMGQELCVLEAMKMQNAIRATRAGRLAAVHVTVGQHVQHNDALVEYEA